MGKAKTPKEKNKKPKKASDERGFEKVVATAKLKKKKKRKLVAGKSGGGDIKVKIVVPFDDMFPVKPIPGETPEELGRRLGEYLRKERPELMKNFPHSNFAKQVDALAHPDTTEKKLHYTPEANKVFCVEAAARLMRQTAALGHLPADVRKIRHSHVQNARMGFALHGKNAKRGFAATFQDDGHPDSSSSASDSDDDGDDVSKTAEYVLPRGTSGSKMSPIHLVLSINTDGSARNKEEGKGKRKNKKRKRRK